MRRACQFICLLLIFVRLQAGEFPFRFEGNLIWVDVRTAKSERTLHFLLDTGATVSVLDLATCKELSLRRGTAVQVAGVGASAQGFWPTTCQASAGGLDLPSKYLVLSLGDLSGACGRHVDGLIGADFFAGRMVQLDFQCQIARTGRDAHPVSADAVLPLKRGPKGALLTQVKVGGTSGWVRVDTGFASAVDWVTSQRTEPTSSRISVGLAQISTPLTKTELRFGEIQMSGVPTGLHARPIFPGESGLLGNAVLSNFLVTLDLDRGQLQLSRRPLENRS